ncbi:Nif3-like dinuclear metal center hexameric protein [Actinomyces sp. 2119]|uniref:Nif3-like dinuclear metal center hexameric protein n=1 Tax=Actinomyces sp. 2119 TaxID=2321393 RepID=UPI002175805A|nr:Nif3-like dinuclear metal center hexameric protein [Actinomyces sp. 2119]
MSSAPHGPGARPPHSSGSPTVADIVAMVDELAPRELAAPWDSNGLICGDPSWSVGHVLLAVDPVQDVVEDAVSRGADMIITHHPLYLRGTDSVRADDAKGHVVHTLIRRGIALLNAHTCLDAAHGGVADALADQVGLRDTVPLEPSAQDPQVGIGRVGQLERPVSLRDLAERVAAVLPDSAPGLLVGGCLEEEVETVAVSGGSGDSLLDAARRAGADVFVTADLRHHPASEHLEAGRPYLLCGTHWATEWVGLPPLARGLAQRAAARGWRLETEVSAVVTDPWALRVPTGCWRP